MKVKVLKSTFAKGYEEVDFESIADIYIVNSCTVTSIADRKTRNMLRRAKKQNPSGKVIVTGCYAETNRKDLLEMEEIDFVIGNKDKSAVAKFVQEIHTQERVEKRKYLSRKGISRI